MRQRNTNAHHVLAAEAHEMVTILSWHSTNIEGTHYAPLDPAALEGVCYEGDPAITASGQTAEG